MLFYGFHHRFGRHIFAQVHHMVPVVFPQHLNNIFANVMNVAFDYSQYDGVARRGVGAGGVASCGCCCVVLRSTPLHLLFDFVKSCFGCVRRHQQLGQEQCLFAKPFPYRVQRRNNKLIDDFQRRFLFFQQFFRGNAALLHQAFYDGVVQGVLRHLHGRFMLGRIRIPGHKLLAAFVGPA